VELFGLVIIIVEYAGGATISHIRSTCGANVKGADVDADLRLLVLSGTPRQVLEAFDIVSEVRTRPPSFHLALLTCCCHSSYISRTSKVARVKRFLCSYYWNIRR
jgi:hypothetical protein